MKPLLYTFFPSKFFLSTNAKENIPTTFDNVKVPDVKNAMSFSVLAFALLTFSLGLKKGFYLIEPGKLNELIR